MTDNKKTLDAIDEAIKDFGENEHGMKCKNVHAIYELSYASKALLEDGGWRDIKTAPKDGVSGKPETYIMLSKQELGTILVCTGYVNNYGAFEWWGGGMLGLTHWKPLDSEARALEILRKIGGV